MLIQKGGDLRVPSILVTNIRTLIYYLYFSTEDNKLQAGGRHNMPPPRPASGDTIYVIHVYGSITNSMSMLACQYSQPKRPGDLDL